jgi:hypothetical protein
MAKPASQPSFASILDTRSGDIERPKPLPAGSYICLVVGQPRSDKASTGTEFLEFTFKILQPLEDVDEDAFKEMKGIGKTFTNRYYVTEEAKWRLKAFLDDCAVGDDDMSLAERIAEINGSKVIATLGHTSTQDGSGVFARVRSTAPVS